MTGPLPIQPVHEAAVLELNNAHSVELSWLEPDQLASLLRQAFHARRIGSVDAFILALDERAAYGSPNFQWFLQRYPRFVYVDRIAVARSARGRGYAQALYRGLFRAVAQAGRDLVVCEVNTEPPNPASEALHAALGFTAVGEAAIHGGSKTVRYLARRLDPPD